MPGRKDSASVARAMQRSVRGTAPMSTDEATDEAPRPLRILLAEGDDDLRKLLVRRLAIAGHAIASPDAAHLNHAIERVQFDVAFVDVTLLDTAGRDLLRSVGKRRIRRVAIAVMSSFETGLDDLTSPPYAMTSLAKPFGWIDFDRAITSAFESLESSQSYFEHDRPCASLQSSRPPISSLAFSASPSTRT